MSRTACPSGHWRDEPYDVVLTGNLDAYGQFGWERIGHAGMTITVTAHSAGILADSGGGFRGHVTADSLARATADPQS